MILSMSIETFTVVHVILSLMGIVSGIGVLVGMLNASRAHWEDEASGGSLAAGGVFGPRIASIVRGTR